MTSVCYTDPHHSYNKGVYSFTKRNHLSVPLFSSPIAIFRLLIEVHEWLLCHHLAIHLLNFEPRSGRIAKQKVQEDFDQERKVDWGESTMIEAERLLLQVALQNPANQRAILLSDSFLDRKEGRYNPKMSSVIQFS
ncbi:hypothetical protein L2E82_15937 [Cichorium intybus]|uniref:Uncharacterized protein n=1 Tax=Cichorium intybus TaxID=13427 RepID=A0ACB9F4L0_CICIN|nr:hypothetical protein L2E82_15937 [Cichorium intybus]